MNVSKAELKRYLTVSLPVLGTMVLASCGSELPPTPSIEDVRASLPPPRVFVANNTLYTRGDPVDTLVTTENICDSSGLTTSISPYGGNMEWVGERFLDPTSPKNRLKISALAKPNTAYQITLSGFNCTEYQGQMVNTAAAVAQFNIIYDNIPPNAEVVETVVQQGKLIFRLKVSDNLSGARQESMEVAIDRPRIGSNTIAVPICDYADNCINQDVSANYEPFSQVIRMNQAQIDPSSGRLVIGGTINDPSSSINLEQTIVKAEQSVLADLPMDLDKVDLACDPPAFQGFDFKLTCTPKGSNGRTNITVTVNDRLGNRYTETIQANVPPLPPERQIAFYSFLAMGILTGGALMAKVAGDAVKRERRGVLAQAIKSRNRGAVQEAYGQLVKRDKKKLVTTVEDYNALTAAEESFKEGKLVDAIVGLRKLYEKKNYFLTDAVNELTYHIVAHIGRALQKHDWRVLQNSEVKNLFNFLTQAYANQSSYSYLWEAVYKDVTASENILGALGLYLIRSDKTSHRSGKMLGLNDPDGLKKHLKALTGWGDFDSLTAMVSKLQNTTIVQRRQLRAIINTEEQTLYNHMYGRLDSLRGMTRAADLRSALDEVKGQHEHYRFSSEYQAKITDATTYLEKKIAMLHYIDTKIQAVAYLAEKNKVTTDTSLGKILSEEIPSFLKNLDTINLLVNRSEREVEAFILGVFAVNLLPLGYFVGAQSIRFQGSYLLVDQIPPPSKRVYAPYHEEGSLAREYKDQLFTGFLKIIYNRLNQEYISPEKHHSGEGPRMTYDKWIPLYDSAIYGKAEVSFVHDYLRWIGMNAAPNHENIKNWYISRVRLVAK